METKKCCKCKEVKPVTEFGKRVKNEDGLNVQCKECTRKANKEWRCRNRTEYNRKNLR